MTFSIIRGSNGRRHEVDFEDDPITIEVGMSDAVVEIVIEAPEDLAPPHKRRFAMLSVPREELMDLPRFGGELVAHARPAISNWTGLW